MPDSTNKARSIVLTQEHKTFLHKYFDQYLQCEDARDRRATANIAADGLIAQFGIVRKEQVAAIRAVRILPWLVDDSAYTCC